MDKQYTSCKKTVSQINLDMSSTSTWTYQPRCAGCLWRSWGGADRDGLDHQPKCTAALGHSADIHYENIYDILQIWYYYMLLYYSGLCVVYMQVCVCIYICIICTYMHIIFLIIRNSITMCKNIFVHEETIYRKLKAYGDMPSWRGVGDSHNITAPKRSPFIAMPSQTTQGGASVIDWL